jgi:hypothetical protein
MALYATVQHDKAQDFVHIRYLATTLASDADVAAFEGEITRGMKRIGRKLDVIVDLGELLVKPTAARAYDEARQRMIAMFTSRAYRYSGSSLVRTKILTSSTIHGQHANVYETFQQALQALLADRARAVASKEK